jgi:hypothetical protein
LVLAPKCPKIPLEMKYVVSYHIESNGVDFMKVKMYRYTEFCVKAAFAKSIVLGTSVLKRSVVQEFLLVTFSRLHLASNVKIISLQTGEGYPRQG